MKARFLVLAIVVGLASVPALGDSINIVETGSFPPPETCCDGGLNIAFTQFIGFRFQLSSTHMLSEVGLMAKARADQIVPITATIFAAILSLDTASALPKGSLLDPGEVLGTTLIEVGPTFTVNEPQEFQDFFGSLSLTLGPGNYAIVFGTGLFGSPRTETDQAIFGHVNIDPEIPDDFFIGIGDIDDPVFANTWHNNGSVFLNNIGTSAPRIIIKGTPVPEPGTLTLLAAGLLAGAAFRKRLK